MVSLFESEVAFGQSLHDVTSLSKEQCFELQEILKFVFLFVHSSFYMGLRSAASSRTAVFRFRYP